MTDAGKLLENATGYTLLIQQPIHYGPGWNQNETQLQMMWAIKNAESGNPSQLVSLPSNMLGKFLLYNGIEYILINNVNSNRTSLNSTLSLVSILKSKSCLQLIYSNGGIYIFKNLDFQYKIISSGVYLDFNWPESSTLLYSLNRTLVNIPYFGQKIPISYIAGVIGINISLTDIEAILTQNYSINLLDLVKGRYAPNPSAPLGDNWSYGIADFPIGSTGIGIGWKTSQSIYYHTLPGKYIVIVGGQEAPYINGTLKIWGVQKNPLIANFSSNIYSFKWVNMGVVESNGTIKIENKGSLYITSIHLIPVSEFQIIEKEALNYSKNITIISAEKSLTNAFVVNNYNITINPYFSVHITQSGINPSSVYVGFSSGAGNDNLFVQWFRIRTQPPNGVMPSVNFGKINKTLDSLMAYVPITLTNPESIATSKNFQQLLIINWSKYASYLNSNCSNVRFYNSTSFLPSNLLPGWIESNNSTSASSSFVWVNLSSTIVPANGSTKIYMAFLPKSASWNETYWGLAPQLTKKYGQFDNGAKVFLKYWNFSGTILPNGWVVTSYTNYKVNNGLMLENTSDGGAIYYNRKLNLTNTIQETLMKYTSTPTTLIYTQIPYINKLQTNIVLSAGYVGYNSNTFYLYSFNGTYGFAIPIAPFDTNMHIFSSWYHSGTAYAMEDYNNAYIYIHNGTFRAKNVIFLVYISQTTFGVGTELITNALVLSNQYINTVYYYVVLGTNYTIQDVGKTNNVRIIEINTLTVGLIFAIPIYIKLRRKKLKIS